MSRIFLTFLNLVGLILTLLPDFQIRGQVAAEEAERDHAATEVAGKVNIAIGPGPKPVKRGRKSKRIEESPLPQKVDSPEPAMPTAQQVCKQWDLNDVDLKYTDADFLNLTTFKLFQQTYRPRLQAENPKVPMSKLVMLVAAKWREFGSLGKGEEAEEPAEEPAGAFRGRRSPIGHRRGPGTDALRGRRAQNGLRRELRRGRLA